MSESALSLQHGIMLHQQQQLQRHLFDTVVSLSHFSILLLTQFLIRFCKGVAEKCWNWPWLLFSFLSTPWSQHSVAFTVFFSFTLCLVVSSPQHKKSIIFKWEQRKSGRKPILPYISDLPVVFSLGIFLITVWLSCQSASSASSVLCLVYYSTSILL